MGRLLLDYIHSIYIIDTLQKSVLEGYRNLISRRSIIFQYKVFSELKETDISQLSDEEKPNLVRVSTKIVFELVWRGMQIIKRSSIGFIG